MTVVRTLAAYEVVQVLHPRPAPSEQDEIGRAVGRAVDGALTWWSHEFRLHRRPTVTAARREAEAIFEEALREADVRADEASRTRSRAEIAGVLASFRQSEVFGLARPRSRLVVIDRVAGFYAQPDYWDGAGRFYEMKSYRAHPPPPDVELQVALFQLAFPGFRAWLACFDRHHLPVVPSIEEVPPLSTGARDALLLRVLPILRERGREKVLEYIESPMVAYTTARG